MHNSVRIISLLLVLFSLFGCSGSYKVDYIDKSYSTDTISVSLLIPQLMGLSDKYFQSEINVKFEESCMEFLNKFKDSSKDVPIPSVFSSESTCYDKNGFLSVVTQIDYYTQKPHNNSFRIVKNINTGTCKEVALSEIFLDASYIDFLNHCLANIVSENPDVYSDLWAKPTLMQNQPYYIKDDCLVLYYPPYELSYYSRGFVEFYVPLTDIGGYLNDEYRLILSDSNH